ncbi:hypothetical protein HDV57DRAFT_508999 [Trichoderma longibrachiatum]
MISVALSICCWRISAAHGFASVYFTSLQSGCAWLQSCKEPKDKPTFEIQVRVQPSKGKKISTGASGQTFCPCCCSSQSARMSAKRHVDQAENEFWLPSASLSLSFRSPIHPCRFLVPACRKSLDKHESQIAGGVAEFAQG